MNTSYTDDGGIEHVPCHMCGTDCTSHPDAANPIAACGDCGKIACLDHRVEDSATRCNCCAAIAYAADGYMAESVR